MHGLDGIGGILFLPILFFIVMPMQAFILFTISVVLNIVLFVKLRKAKK